MGGSIVMELPQNRWFIWEKPTKMDDLEVPPFMETPIYCMFSWENLLVMQRGAGTLGLGHMTIEATDSSSRFSDGTWVPQLLHG